MKYTSLFLSSSASRSVTNRNDIFEGRHFRWDSIKTFIYLAYAFSSSSYHFDIFSGVMKFQPSFPLFILTFMWVGMAYMIMDIFVKQYTRRLDCYKHLNPLLRGVSFGILLQTAFWSLIHARDLGDSIRFFFSSFYTVPAWSKCQKNTNNITCFSSQDILKRCRNHVTTDLNVTSVHENYMKLFSVFAGTSITTRFFVNVIVWISNFFILTFTDDRLLKLFKLSFMWRVFSTVFVFVILSPRSDMIDAFYDLMNLKVYHYKVNTNYITNMYGIGLIGVYDMGAMSPYTMVDNAVIIFSIVLSTTSLARSLIVRVLVVNMKTCVNKIVMDNPHYLFFAILPLSADFMHANKIYVFYIYTDLTASTIACLAMFTLTISRQLHNELKSVKNIYIVGIFCLIGCLLSLPLNAIKTTQMSRIILSLNQTTLYLGVLKTSIVMWIYGVEKFSTDIQFLLGFKPTKFWRILWVFMPFLILLIFIYKLYVTYVLLSKKKFDKTVNLCADLWFVIMILIVLAFHIKTIARFILRNNLVGIFKSSNKYGPPDPEERLKRRQFDETILYRRCIHNCNVLDERYDCNHLPLTCRSPFKSSNPSLASIFDSQRQTDRSVTVDVTNLN